MADARFSFQEKGKSYQPQWMAPEALSKHPKTINTKAADMWSFAVLLWELSSREIPFPDYSPMEAGMKVTNAYISFYHLLNKIPKVAWLGYSVEVLFSFCVPFPRYQIS